MRCLSFFKRRVHVQKQTDRRTQGDHFQRAVKLETVRLRRAPILLHCAAVNAVAEHARVKRFPMTAGCSGLLGLPRVTLPTHGVVRLTDADGCHPARNTIKDVADAPELTQPF
jgi:hypothetical protein